MKPARPSAWVGIAVLALHGAALLAGLGFAYATIADVRTQQAAVDQAADALAQLDARLKGGATPPPVAAAAGDPFLAGASVAMASANLQDRVVAAIRRLGGTVNATQVETPEAGDAAGAAGLPVSLTVTFQLPQPGLQGLLYDLEASPPTLFVDQLTVEAPPDARDGGAASAAALRIALTVSAYRNDAGKS